MLLFLKVMETVIAERNSIEAFSFGRSHVSRQAVPVKTFKVFITEMKVSNQRL